MVDFEEPDQLSILTYTSQFYHKFAKVPPSPSKATTEVRSLIFSVRELSQEGQVCQQEEGSRPQSDGGGAGQESQVRLQSGHQAGLSAH